MTNDVPFKEQMSRIQLVTGKRTQTELADFLGIGPSAVSDAKEQGKIPSDWLVILLRVKNVYPEWILTGNGPCFITLPPKLDCYTTGAETADRRADEKALRRLSSQMLADELIRRIAVSQKEMICAKKDG